MRVHLGSDHAGFELKQALVAWLQEQGHEAVDHGPASYDPEDDYPPFVLRAAEGVVADPGSLGIVLGGSGNGEQIAANKVTGVRAVLAYDQETAALGRRHNDANVIAMGGRFTPPERACDLVKVFLETAFEGGRHARRLGLLAAYEAGEGLPPLPGE
ncbi:ribose 5-phosphate isomerase B [Motilibacter rhizosphaerae]|uniref:Ribose-5-phosphate isomerase B n=1 Tax=Motilibacter rhizosphaerae TaxID=598652 RepID=A0A4V2F4M2_9ACTN|nr:ribose-5-phosphate isomerase [Motilibacter rhizosphaerae]RZS89809.1 ribose 5-phosphate isomerase B [Motilibacter rhizosphaerae]